MKKRAIPTRALIAAGLGAAVFQIVATLPASLAPSLAGFARTGVKYETATGTLWKGVLTGVQASGVDFGEVRFAASPAALLTGKLKTPFSMKGGALTGYGIATARTDGILSVKDGRFEFKLDAATRYAFLGEPLDGIVRADVEHLTFSRRGCVESKTRLSTNVLAGPARRFSSEAFDLAGDSICDGDDLFITLAGRGEEGAVTLAIRVTPSMAYTLTATAIPARQDITEALQFLGFEKEGGTLKIGANGVIKAVGS